ncbi:hypothetical protein Apa02nite_094050 [Actinoplanes palleronii]|uniref:Uncharacterized protein n=1 Tax=Actinoplanes palleronii TaxID=113570 RepID=A0ABQ4BRL5_9ACTN|nr:hypothetical protein Apa02nite_094050 [Actinoplanes palleronii]
MVVTFPWGFTYAKDGDRGDRAQDQGDRPGRAVTAGQRDHLTGQHRTERLARGAARGVAQRGRLGGGRRRAHAGDPEPPLGRLDNIARLRVETGR